MTAFFASSIVAATTTPLPNANPSALTTIGASCVSRYASALSISVKISHFAVGMPYLRIRFLEKILLASICAAYAVGPNAGMPSSSRRSTQPNASGSSGVTQTKSTFSFFASATMPSTSVAFTSGMQRATCAMPALPGTQRICVTSFDSLSFLQTACSRPPPPITNTFISSLLV